MSHSRRWRRQNVLRIGVNASFHCCFNAGNDRQDDEFGYDHDLVIYADDAHLATNGARGGLTLIFPLDFACDPTRRA